MGPMNGTFLWFHSGECPSAPCQDEYEAEDNNLEPTERVDADDEFGVEADDVEDVSQLEIAPRRSRERLVTLFEWETWAWGKDVGIWCLGVEIETGMWKQWGFVNGFENCSGWPLFGRNYLRLVVFDWKKRGDGNKSAPVPRLTR